jgi:hypothetical protein
MFQFWSELSFWLSEESHLAMFSRVLFFVHIESARELTDVSSDKGTKVIMRALLS